MFTFSSGFEAATLKIPNKEFTSYGGLIGGTASSAVAPGIGVGVNGIRGGAFHYAGLNDPYNMVTVNQGGVVVDGGRDGGMASWPAAAPLNVNDDPAGSHYLGPGINLSMSGLNTGGAPSSGANLPPRKQIIGFAKFRSREEALAARDVLQGRRVDIEKGAVLKAEMAKKNLHTKRGVGPIPAVGSASGGMQHSQGQQQQTNALDSFDNYREKEHTTSSLPPTSLAHLSRLGWRDPVVALTQQEANMNVMNGSVVRVDEEERKRENLVTMSLAMGLPTTNNSTSSASSTVAVTAGPVAPRGARERAEDDERERRRKEKEKERERELNLMKLRASNSAAYDAFHGISVGIPISRQSSAGIGSTAGNVNGAQLESVAGSSPLLAEVDIRQQQHLHYADEVVGPWDRVGSMSTTTVGRPSSASQCSSSPPPIDINPNEAEYEHEYDEYQLHIQQQIQHRRQDSPSGYMSNENGSLLEGRSGDRGTNDPPSHEGSIPRSELVLNTNGLHQLQRIGQYQHHPQALQHQQQLLHGVAGTEIRNGGSQTSGSGGGDTSPQLPSPTSGGSTTSASLRGTVDQNPPVSYFPLFFCA
jgi:hypothetical protein